MTKFITKILHIFHCGVCGWHQVVKNENFGGFAVMSFLTGKSCRIKCNKCGRPISSDVSIMTAEIEEDWRDQY